MNAARLTASDVMSAPVVVARENESVRDAARLMLESGVGALPVVSASGAAIGMVSDGDLLGHRRRDPRREWWLDLFSGAGADLPRPQFVDGRPVREVMSAPLISVSPRTPVAECAELMRLNHIKRLPVIQGEEIVGLVSRADFIGLIETLTPQKDKAGNSLVDFLESLIGGASLSGLPRRRPVARAAAVRPGAVPGAGLCRADRGRGLARSCPDHHDRARFRGLCGTGRGAR